MADEKQNILERLEEKMDNLESRIDEIESVLEIEHEDEDNEWDDDMDEELEDEDIETFYRFPNLRIIKLTNCGIKNHQILMLS